MVYAFMPVLSGNDPSDRDRSASLYLYRLPGFRWICGAPAGI